MNTTTASTIRAIIRLAIGERRRRDSFPADSSTSLRADAAYRAHLLAAWTVAFQAKAVSSKHDEAPPHQWMEWPQKTIEDVRVFSRILT